MYCFRRKGNKNRTKSSEKETRKKLYNLYIFCVAGYVKFVKKKSSTLPPNIITPNVVNPTKCIILSHPAAALLNVQPPSKQASFLFTYMRPPFVPPSSFCPSSKSPYFNHDSGSLRLQSSSARIPRCFAYPLKSVSTFLPSQHIVPPPHLRMRSASQGRSSTAEPVQAAAECRLLRLLKTLSDGCSVFPSP